MSGGLSGALAGAAASRELAVAQRLLRAHAVDRTSMGDRHGPAAHPTASRVEAGGLAPELDEDLLRDLLGRGRDRERPAARCRRPWAPAGRRARRTPTRRPPATRAITHPRRHALTHSDHRRRSTASPRRSCRRPMGPATSPTCGSCSEPVREADQSPSARSEVRARRGPGGRRRPRGPAARRRRTS